MWKTIAASAIGTSHLSAGTECQDVCRVTEISVDDGKLLIACTADGAGSAVHSADGARIACETFLSVIERELHHLGSGVTRDTVVSWLGELRSTIEYRARELGVESRELASTFLGAVIGETGALFVQIGDGAIVRWNGYEYVHVFWPQSGEFANTTNFLTDKYFSNHVEWCRLDERVDELAIFTDGLERLVLRFAEKTVHQPFFQSFFPALRATPSPEVYLDPLRAFLDSQLVNERTDDDKTLLLATRMPDIQESDEIR